MNCYALLYLVLNRVRLQHSKYGPEFDNCYSLFARAARLYPYNYCLGSRQTLPSGNAGAFTWMTFSTVHEQAHHVECTA